MIKADLQFYLDTRKALEEKILRLRQVKEEIKNATFFTVDGNFEILFTEEQKLEKEIKVLEAKKKNMTENLNGRFIEARAECNAMYDAVAQKRATAEKDLETLTKNFRAEFKALAEARQEQIIADIEKVDTKIYSEVYDTIAFAENWRTGSTIAPQEYTLYLSGQDLERIISK